MVMIVAVIAIPFTYAMHTHAYHAADDRCIGSDRCGDHDLNGEHGCSTCEFYGRYVPVQADFKPPYTFRIAAVRLEGLFRAPACQSPCEGRLVNHTNKGPPYG
ncbi:hypothetical protein [Parapedobacter deserti]